MDDLPSGTVTLLFTDVEGSTLLVQALGAAYQDALAEHRQILRDAVASHAGREVDCRADELLAQASHAPRTASPPRSQRSWR